jgi:thiamine transport system permease protein
MALLGVVLLVSARVQSRGSVRQALRAAGQHGGPVRRPGQRLLIAGVLVVVAVLLVVPMAAVVVGSLRVHDSWGLAWWRALGSVDAGTTAFAAPWDSVRVSLQYATVTALLAAVIGGLAACAVAYSGRGGRFLDTAATLPLGTSAVTVGFGMVLAFSRAPLDLRGSWWLVPLAHTLVAVPFVLAAAVPVLRSIDPRLRQVAAMLGARPTRAWRTVDLPLLARALAVGAGFAFAVSLGEFGATAFLARSGSPTLPVQIAALLNRPGEVRYGAALALATILMLVTAVALLVAELTQPAVRRLGR